MTATLSRDHVTGRRWLAFATRPAAETLAALRSAGWRWSSYRSSWNHPSRSAVVPAGIEVQDGGEVEYSAERADRLAARAESARAAGEAALSRGSALVEGIPLGQPILVGHHSERRHRRAVERSHAATAKGVELLDVARDLERRAESSRLRHEEAATAPAIARRIDRLRADERQCVRRQSDPVWVGEAARAQNEARLVEVRSRLAVEVAALAEAGGLPDLEIRRGDVVRIDRVGEAHVVRVGPKTIVYVTAYTDSPLRADRSRVLEIIRRAT